MFIGWKYDHSGKLYLEDMITIITELYEIFVLPTQLLSTEILFKNNIHEQGIHEMLNEYLEYGDYMDKLDEFGDEVGISFIFQTDTIGIGFELRNGIYFENIVKVKKTAGYKAISDIIKKNSKFKLGIWNSSKDMRNLIRSEI